MFQAHEQKIHASWLKNKIGTGTEEQTATLAYTFFFFF